LPRPAVAQDALALQDAGGEDAVAQDAGAQDAVAQDAGAQDAAAQDAVARQEAATQGAVAQQDAGVKEESIDSRSDDGVDRRTHTALGGDLALWDLPSEPTGHPVELGVVPFVRFRTTLSEHVHYRTDLAAGVLWAPCDQCQSTDVWLLIRPDMEFDVSSHYTISVGMDVGVDLWVLSFSGGRVSTQVHPYLVIGTHVSLLTLRFGARGEYVVAATEGVFGAIGLDGHGSFPALTQTVGFSYLFPR
jgi:hypothetical protein